MDRLHTVVPTEDSYYQWWQIEALWASFQRVGQPGRFTALVASASPSATVWPFLCPHEVTAWYSQQEDDYYPVYNKPGSLGEWLERTEPGDDTILIVDPDCLLLQPLVRRAEPGRPISQHVNYMRTDHPRARHLIATYCRRNLELVRPIGIPTFIHEQDLRDIMPRWSELILAIRDDDTGVRPEKWASDMWTCDMWAFNIALAEAGLDCSIERDLCQWSIEDTDARPLIHYCYSLANRGGAVHWDKRRYRPWRKLPEPTPGLPRAGRRLLEELDRIAAERGYAEVPKPEGRERTPVARGRRR